MSAQYDLAVSLALLVSERRRHDDYFELGQFWVESRHCGVYGLGSFRVWRGWRRVIIRGVWVGTRAEALKLAWLADQESAYLRQRRLAWLPQT